MLGFDSEIYFYSYPYKALGNSSPTFCWKGTGLAFRFFMEQFEMIWNDSEMAAEVYEQ